MVDTKRTAIVIATVLMVVGSGLVGTALAGTVDTSFSTVDPDSVTVGPNHVFVKGYDGSTNRIQAYDKSGNLDWQITGQAGSIQYNHVSNELFVSGFNASLGEDRVVWIDPDTGSILESRSGPGTLDIDIDSDGNIYTAEITQAYSWGPNRQLRWSKTVGESGETNNLYGVSAGPFDSNVYVTRYDANDATNELYKLDTSDGSIVRQDSWPDSEGGGLEDVETDSDGNVYLFHDSGGIRKLDSVGNELEPVTNVASGFVTSSASYSGETDKIYVGDSSSNLLAINPDLSIDQSVSNPNDVIDSRVDERYSSSVKVWYGVVADGVYEFDTGQLVNPSTVSGTVTDADTNDAIQQATINVTNETGSQVAQTTTNDVGQYSVDLINGSYTVTVSKQDYSKESQDVTISGSDETVDFALNEFNQSIELRTKQYLEHGQESRYSVIVSVDGNRQNVTSEATVVSGNTSVVTVDSGRFYIVATSNIQVNQRTTLTATWTDSDGNTYTTERNVTVANATVANTDILPTWTSVSASLSDQTLQVILLATMVGAGAAALASSFAGLSASTGIVVLGWFAGYTSDGILIVSFMFAMFVGLNLSQNTTIMNRSG